MRIKLLKKIRRKSYIEIRNSKYRAGIKSGWFWSRLKSSRWTTKEGAEKDLRRLILMVVNIEFKREKRITQSNSAPSVIGVCISFIQDKSGWSNYCQYCGNHKRDH